MGGREPPKRPPIVTRKRDLRHCDLAVHGRAGLGLAGGVMGRSSAVRRSSGTDRRLCRGHGRI